MRWTKACRWILYHCNANQADFEFKVYPQAQAQAGRWRILVYLYMYFYGCVTQKLSSFQI